MKSKLMILLVIAIFTAGPVCDSGGDDDDDDAAAPDDDAIVDDDATDDDATDDDAADDDASDDDAADDDAADDDDDDDTPILTPGFVFIPAGTFTMGSPTDEPGRQENEVQHTVTLTNDFEMSAFETTQELFTTLMGWNPSHFGPNGAGAECGDDCPVESVSWHDAVACANELSADAGYAACYSITNVVCKNGSFAGSNYMDCMNTTDKGIDAATVALDGVTSVYDCEGYRLPTESEWEYAARGGATTAFYNGPITHTDCTLDPNLDEIGWYCGNDSDTTEAVGQKLENEWDLFDMSGNVWEWTWDWSANYPTDPTTDPEGPANGTGHVARGGGWSFNALYCRSAFRYSVTPGYRSKAYGFRMVRSLP